MVTKQSLCSQIESMFPEFGTCGIDFKVKYDRKAHAWAVDIHKGKRHLKTFIEDSEADSCVDKNSCLPLALQISQLKSNFNKYLHEHALEQDH